MKQAAASKMFVPAPGDCPPADQSSSRDRQGGTGYVEPVGFTSRVPDCGGAEEEQPAKSAGGLAQEVAGQGKAPGGIDFSRLELHYLADPGKGGLRYAFQAPLAASGDRSATTGLGARESSDDRAGHGPRQSASVQAHNEALFRQLILPKVVSAVNTAPEYADLRRVYLSRVAAEWYRQLSAKQTTTYGPLIDEPAVDTGTRQVWLGGGDPAPTKAKPGTAAAGTRPPRR